MKETFIKLLNATNIRGMDNLIEVMEEGGFFEAPCSTKYHLAKESGLLEHSINVFNVLVQLDEALGADLDYTDMVVCALLHDLGKMGDYGKPYYIKEILEDDEKAKSVYKYNPELISEAHEVRSVLIANRFIDLTEEQVHAILHHNGLYGALDDKKHTSYDRYKLSFLLHTADMWCSRFEED